MRLLAAAAPALRCMTIAVLDAGVRRGEMLAVRFADIDRDRWLMTLRPAISAPAPSGFLTPSAA